MTDQNEKRYRVIKKLPLQPYDELQVNIINCDETEVDYIFPNRFQVSLTDPVCYEVLSSVKIAKSLVQNNPDYFQEVKEYSCHRCQTAVDIDTRLCKKCHDLEEWTTNNKLVGIMRDLVSSTWGYFPDMGKAQRAFDTFLQANKSRIDKFKQEKDVMIQYSTLEEILKKAKVFTDKHPYTEDDMINFGVDCWTYIYAKDDYVDRKVSAKKAFEEWKRKAHNGGKE